MKMLVMEDEYVSRSVLMEILSPYGQVDSAENGKEAMEKFQKALENSERYDIVFLDIMVPEISGQDVLKNIRALEQQYDDDSLITTKIIMTTALGDFNNVKTAFKQQCEAYLIKPLDRDKVLNTLQGLGLIGGAERSVIIDEES
ncbi:MAG: response regulator [Ignavibacteria bacterium]|nr:response regulator [Ignavibacteria bacterium]MBL7992443.1 response regulator [Candidatus Kapabacteria bacterium]